METAGMRLIGSPTMSVYYNSVTANPDLDIP
jgi:hypothetical protein